MVSQICRYSWSICQLLKLQSVSDMSTMTDCRILEGALSQELLLDIISKAAFLNRCSLWLFGLCFQKQASDLFKDEPNLHSAR